MSTDNDSADTATDGGLPPGTVLSDTYAIERQIGLGGMAEVYRARNIHTDEPVAIKVVLPEFARDQTNLALFKKEATVLSRLHHDAIVRYHTFTIEKSMNRPYLVMEFVDGVPLSDHIKKTPLDAASTRILVSRIASGLEVAHQADVIHRDLSPDNVILPEDDVGKAKIVDFGIAKAAKIGDGTLLGGKFAGKYNFVSPEQLGLAGGEVTGASDIYSLGLIAAAAQLGHPIDMSGSQLDVVEKRRTIPDLTGVDPSIRPIIARMLEPLPENRPRSMAEVIALLEAPPGDQPLNDTGTVFGAAMPYVPPPSRDPWGGGAPQQRSLPPQPSSWPQQPAAPIGSWPAPETSIPPGFAPGGETSLGTRGTGVLPGFAPPGETSLGTRGNMPPGGLAGVSAPATPGPELTTPPRSESPFGPYEGAAAGGPPTFGKSRAAKAKARKGGGAGLFIALGVLVVLLGGGAVFFLQGGFGLLGPAPLTPEAPTPTTTTTAQPTTVPPTTVPSSTVQSTVVADLPSTTTTIAPPSVTGAAARVAWVRDYKLGTCAFATPVTVAENAMSIEGFGNAVAPFEQLATDFQKDNSFDPNVQVQLIADPQCAAADFLRAVQPLNAPGPSMALSATNLPSGGALSGTLRNTAGWTTDLLLIDYRGGVQNVSVFLTSTGDGATFALPPLISKATEPVPMMLVAISSTGGLNTTRLVRTHEARQIFPVILHEIETQDGKVSVTAKYFKLGGAAPASTTP
jgi:serine/threonine-protein kinase